MFTTSDFGKTPGDTEVFTPDKVTNMAQGLQVVVTGLSPISVGWTAPTTNPDTPPSGNHGGGGWSSSTYAITVEKSEHGKVTSNRTNASNGSAVTLTVTPDSGYVLDTLTVTDSRGNEIKLTAQGGNKYTFTMPSRAVTVKASFVPLPDDTQKPCDGGADCPSHGFTDPGTVGTWYHEAVDYVLRNGLMNGYSNGTFGPNDNLSRAQFAQILFNKEGRPVVNYLLRWIFRRRFIQRRRQRNGLFVDDVLVAAELAALVRGLVALDVPGPLQFVDSGTNSVLALPVDVAQAGQGIVPIFREAKYLRQQALGFQGQGFVPQVVVGHDRVALVPLHAEYWHGFPLLSVSGHEKTPQTFSKSAAFACPYAIQFLCSHTPYQ